MVSVEQRLQMKREPLDTWSIREQLCLASAVARSGDQNWMSVSRALKPFGDQNRPTDWFHQKNCAAQYGALLANVETPKRKKRTSGGEIGIETPGESILRKLKSERITELKKFLDEERAEYLKLQENMTILSSGKFTEEQLDKWCKEIDEEEFKKEQESIAHSQWLREREMKKQEIERAWRPVKPSQPLMISQKRKNSGSLENLFDIDQNLEENQPTNQESQKTALSPLLTSLLKSPSQAQNVTTSSILHSAITNQRPTNTNTNPMIASLLNSTTNVTVSPGLQQLVSSAIGQEPENEMEMNNQETLSSPDILDDETLSNLKIEDIENSMMAPDGPLPDIKNEVDVIISDLIADPEQHLQLDGNGDININLELDDLDDVGEPEPDVTEHPEPENATEKEEVIAPPTPVVDPFEFQEDPELFDTKPLSKSNPKQTDSPTKQYPTSFVAPPVAQKETVNEECVRPTPPPTPPVVIAADSELEAPPEIEVIKKEKEELAVPGSVEIVEVVELEEREIGKELNKSQIQDIVHSSTVDTISNSSKVEVEEPLVEIKTEVDVEETVKEEVNNEVIIPTPPVTVTEVEVEAVKEPNISLDDVENTEDSTLATPDFTEELYDDITMEVKVDKTGKMKRDYSRKKKEEKDFDMLLAIEKAQLEESEFLEEVFSEREFQDAEKKDTRFKLRNETERSNSPWTEEEDVSSNRSKRRYSTPATPNDSVPNSPASSSAFCDDDKEYRTWKKSIMLLYSTLAAHKYSSLFLKPITEEQAPGYHGLVHRPMDFHTIKKNIENGVIRTTQEFQRDVMLMLQNAIMYNKTNSTVYNMTREIQKESIEAIQLLLQAQSDVDLPLRRETRTSEPGAKRKRVSEVTGPNKKRKED